MYDHIFLGWLGLGDRAGSGLAFTTWLIYGLVGFRSDLGWFPSITSGCSLGASGWVRGTTYLALISIIP